jgi:N-acetylmuramoyl-L-alanine amidase
MRNKSIVILGDRPILILFSNIQTQNQNPYRKNMKFTLPLRLATAATVALTSIIPFNSARSAASFDEQLVEQSKVIAIARPYGNNKYDLLVVEQIPDKNQCWSESGSNPAQVNPLLLNFDFTGHCRRATDSNGYSIRIDNRDYGLNYLLSVAQRNGELVLVGTPRTGGPEIVVGRTRGMGKGFMKFVLEPGWTFTKRAFEGKELGHFYFSGNGEDIIAAGGVLPPNHTPGTGIAFRDIGDDIYKAEIEEAVSQKFIAGFREDSTFRPQQPLTREQLVSMVIEAFKTLPDVKLNVSDGVTKSPYPDVQASRWSAAKIQWAQQNQIVSGYPDGTFQPTREVTRAELIAVLQKASQYVQQQRPSTAQLPAKQASTKTTFSDTNGHWAEMLVNQMSAYCQVASPLNETGTKFAPNQPAFRNYSAAATLRMLDCLKGTNNVTTSAK